MLRSRGLRFLHAAVRWLSCAGILVICLASASDAVVERPHIVFILADDMGWNDVGFHGSAQIPTPNLDALAYAGLILNRQYVTALCTPSRSALMTGRHPIHTGMQHTVLYAAEPRGLPLGERLLPEYLRDLGYATHIVGKWHLGHYRAAYTPTRRGFDSHLGYWTGHQDYFDHRAEERNSLGLDMRRDMEVAYDLDGLYTTDVLAAESVRLIGEHRRKGAVNATTGERRPMFLYMAHAAVHSGNPSPYNPLPAPEETVKEMANIEDVQRRRFAAMMVHLDRSVGAVVQALSANDMLANSVIVFSTDNGGAAAGFNLNAASNWPLRGVKNTLWEGGVRGAALVWSPLLVRGANGGRVAEQRMHIMDWMPTLYRAAGGNVSDLVGDLDAHDVWDALRTDTRTTRTENLHNIDERYGNAALTVDNWKLLSGTTYQGQWDQWYGPSGQRDPAAYNISAVLASPAARALGALGAMPAADVIAERRQQATVSCDNNLKPAQQRPCDLRKSMCLFDVWLDPCERNNLAELEPEIVARLFARLQEYRKSAVPPANVPLDPRGDPKFWNGTWTNFGDFEDATPMIDGVEMMSEKTTILK